MGMAQNAQRENFKEENLRTQGGCRKQYTSAAAMAESGGYFCIGFMADSKGFGGIGGRGYGICF